MVDKAFVAIANTLTRIYTQFSKCEVKMNSATRFMEFFVNDMLDYAVLQNSEHGFIKQMKCFDIRVAVDEILSILDRKIKIKKLTIE